LLAKLHLKPTRLQFVHAALRLMKSSMMIERHTEIIFNKQVASKTYLMGLKCPELVAEARPGQFVMIQVRSGIDPLLRRPFSICGTHNDEDFLILYKVVGRGTAIMSTTRQGQKLSTLGPLGKGFDIARNESTSLLVAGGIGIAALIFLAQTIETKNLTLLAGYRCAPEIVRKEAFDLNATKLLVSTDDGSVGHHGPVTELLESHLAASTQRTSTIFTCGPLPMMERVAALAVEWNIPCQVSLEAYMACGLGACQGCAVTASVQESREYLLVCQDGPVFNAQKLDWKKLHRTQNL
jgi:dihydroorotate dehydrogenase electron transfer subunit